MDVGCLAVLRSLMIVTVTEMIEKVNVHLEPSLHIDVAHLVPAEEGIVFQNHLGKHSSTKTINILKRTLYTYKEKLQY